MEFVKELCETNDAETFHVWTEIVDYVDDGETPYDKYASVVIDDDYVEPILSIAKLIDECYMDDHAWEQYAMTLFKHKRFDVYPICDTGSKDGFRISFEALFHAVCYLASCGRVDGRITPDVVRAYGEKLVLRYDEFENAILELIQERYNGKGYDELQRMIMPTLVPDDTSDEECLVIDCGGMPIPDDWPVNISENEYSDDGGLVISVSDTGSFVPFSWY